MRPSFKSFFLYSLQQFFLPLPSPFSAHFESTFLMYKYSRENMQKGRKRIQQKIFFFSFSYLFRLFFLCAGHFGEEVVTFILILSFRLQLSGVFAYFLMFYSCLGSVLSLILLIFRSNLQFMMSSNFFQYLQYFFKCWLLIGMKLKLIKTTLKF